MDRTCLITAALFVSSHVLDLIYDRQFQDATDQARADYTTANNNNNNNQTWSSSSCTSDEDNNNWDPWIWPAQWAFRSQHVAWEQSIGWLSVLSWWALLVLMIRLAWPPPSDPGTLRPLPIGLVLWSWSAALARTVATLLVLGGTLVLTWMATPTSSSFSSSICPSVSVLDSWLTLATGASSSTHTAATTAISNNSTGKVLSMTQQEVAGHGDEIGWKTLQVVYTAVQGLSLWFDLLETLSLAVLLFLVYLFVAHGTSRPASHARHCSIEEDRGPIVLLTLRWASMALFMSLLWLLQFLGQLAVVSQGHSELIWGSVPQDPQHHDSMATQVTIWLGLFNRCVGMPLLLLWWGVQWRPRSHVTIVEFASTDVHHHLHPSSFPCSSDFHHQQNLSSSSAPVSQDLYGSKDEADDHFSVVMMNILMEEAATPITAASSSPRPWLPTTGPIPSPAARDDDRAQSGHRKSVDKAVPSSSPARTIATQESNGTNTSNRSLPML